ncbi:AAA15 family ATPase/GTPase [Wenyingzhuangia heitensis]|uniref:AAA15 family ATPase/GTPase n=1 Tax=Wenyingzhuangia heitensis TaxID=1487859 RepID=A0ABX0UDU2_9FLAO|nr:AAA family ATPase [Wenyingzhuangia heitensis]NIJ46593.1 AAA15 family ATPase/GTPase [Wenyingzhuangia heitensis]
MSLIKNIVIKNFRGFKELKIEDINHINILVGNNNSGKSSVLEAFFLIMGMSNPLLPDNINRIRGLKFKNANDFKFLFHQLNLENTPKIECTFNNEVKRSLTLEPIITKNTSSSNNIDEIEASSAAPNINGLNLKFSNKIKHSPNKSYKSSLIFNPPSELIPTFNNNYQEEYSAVLLSGNISDDNALRRYSEILKHKKGNIVLKAIQKIDPKIINILPLKDGLYFDYEDINELVPVNLSGDGVRKFLNIVTTIAEKQNSFILIDEIENGLHYSAHKGLWESIINISKEFNTQLFITSHNIETLKCVKELLEETKYIDYQQKISIYKLAQTKKQGAKTYKYTFDGFKSAIDLNTEIR